MHIIMLKIRLFFLIHMTHNLQERTNMNNSSVVPAGASPVVFTGSVPSVFSNEQFGSVRVIVKDNGEPLFCLKDVCDCLDLEQPSKVANRIDKDELTGLQIPSDGQSRAFIFVTESGLYDVILGSRSNEKTKPFKKWVTSEVLPSIRKTGSYSVARPSYQIEDPIARAQKWIEEEKERRNLLAENTKQAELIEMNRPKVEAYDGFMATGQNVHIGTFVKSVRDKLPHIKITQDWVFQRLRDAGYLMKDGMRRNLAYAKYCINGGYRLFRDQAVCRRPYYIADP